MVIMSNRFYTREIAKKIGWVSSPIIRTFTGKDKYVVQPASENAPVFIIGAPRTGSTILYQLLTNELDVLYIDNLIDVFFRNFLAAFKMSNRLFGSKPHNCFKSVHGNTWKCGLHAPSECGDFWYQWLPRDRHYITPEDVSRNVIENIQGNINAPLAYFNKPLVFKNMNAGLRLKLIKSALPDSKFIFVKRDPVDTAISILNVRKKTQGSIDKWWSLIPPNHEELLPLSPVQQVVNQIYRIEKQIISDLKLFPEGNTIVVNYPDIMISYEDVIKELKEFMGPDTQYRQGAQNPNLREQKGSTHSLRNEIEETIKDLDWDDYTS
jgi:hypothetical protein